MQRYIYPQPHSFSTPLSVVLRFTHPLTRPNLQLSALFPIHTLTNHAPHLILTSQALCMHVHVLCTALPHPHITWLYKITPHLSQWSPFMIHDIQLQLVIVTRWAIMYIWRHHGQQWWAIYSTRVNSQHQQHNNSEWHTRTVSLGTSIQILLWSAKPESFIYAPDLVYPPNLKIRMIGMFIIWKVSS